MIWHPFSDEWRSNIFTGVESPSMDQWYTEVSVTKDRVFKVIHFQKTTSSVIVWAFIFDFISMLKIWRVFWAAGPKFETNYRYCKLFTKISSLDTFQSYDLASRVHYGRISANRPADRILRIVHIDDDDLRRVANLLTDANELVRFHCQVGEGDWARIDVDVGELLEKTNYNFYGRRYFRCGMEE